MPRQVRTRLKAVETARDTLQHDLGRTPEPEEVAAAAGLSLAELRDLDRPHQIGSATDDEIAMVDSDGPALGEALEDEHTRELLMTAVRRLPERDQVVVALYFFEGFPLAEIGQVLDVTESRVSQLRSRTFKALRAELTPLLSIEAA